MNNWLIGSLMDEWFYAKRMELKGNAVGNYRSISCLPLLWKLLAGIISENLLRDKREENWKERQMHGQFIRDMPEGTEKEKLPSSG